MALLVRTKGEPQRVVPALRSEIALLDPALPLYGVATLKEHVAAASASERLLALLGGGFGLFALVIAAIGLYALLSWFVLQQRREMAVRLALGARSGQVRRLVLRRGLRLAGAGAALGLLGDLALGRAARALLFEVPAADPLALGTAAAALLAAAFVACWLPARRAGAVDPMRALEEG
jgi:ABC-type antimicrobial peptide transport system permease subunit